MAQRLDTTTGSDFVKKLLAWLIETYGDDAVPVVSGLKVSPEHMVMLRSLARKRGVSPEQILAEALDDFLASAYAKSQG